MRYSHYYIFTNHQGFEAKDGCSVGNKPLAVHSMHARQFFHVVNTRSIAIISVHLESLSIPGPAFLVHAYLKTFFPDTIAEKLLFYDISLNLTNSDDNADAVGIHAEKLNEITKELFRSVLY